MTNSNHSIKTSILFIFSIIIFIWCGCVQLKKLSFEKQECDIKNVTYTRSMGDIDNLVNCRCGRRNKCFMGTSITLKGGIYGTNEFRIFVPDTDLNAPESQVKHTFFETSCQDVEKKDNRKNQLTINRNNAEKYIEVQNKEEPINCYQRKGDTVLYLNNTDRSIEFYTACGFLVFSSILMCLCFCPCFKSHTPTTSNISKTPTTSKTSKTEFI